MIINCKQYNTERIGKVYKFYKSLRKKVNNYGEEK